MKINSNEIKLSVRTENLTDLKEVKQEITNIIKLFDGKAEIKSITKRKCDCCDCEIKIGDKFKGKGFNEFCEKCVKNKDIKGNWNINKGT